MEPFKSHNSEKFIFRDILEDKSQFERQQEHQEDYFGQFIINHEHKPIFSQYTLFIQEFYNREEIF